jgi:plasmid stability protein
MAVQSLTLNVPERLHRWLAERAARSHRSVGEETLEVLGTAVPGGDLLPQELADAVAPMPLLDDDSLRRAPRSRLPDEAAERLADLHRKRQREGLIADEDQERAALVWQYERAILIRAEAAAELHRRGHNVRGLVGP